MADDTQSVEARKQRYKELMSAIDQKKKRIEALRQKIAELYKKVEQKESKEDMAHLTELETELNNL